MMVFVIPQVIINISVFNQVIGCNWKRYFKPLFDRLVYLGYYISVIFISNTFSNAWIFMLSDAYKP